MKKKTVITFHRPRSFGAWAFCGALILGCADENAGRQNDAGPPIERNEEGPGPMPRPEESGASTLPSTMEDGK